ncbi:hypothetical protein AGABI1DRAFT_116395 [Agaricus bisporus var. burnettii JB137-S8]|uniref:BTB domain-containing protein n=1 Tax=Agaricus bisporus var. burnettii (strain JB137-S8 / ATCC MYA-4627 / FGSC 10392) TaxID=597362 RepID=K5WXP7_AGABU|nr:uncharacterized protein AGABI1DRAFT_116395 [Agaricus bisporus var. burnettii JB137-S8]EKM75367.1 hypothetical protein AGABI1DRAFT_116395 [Agaricus bisporus var. burnettii JB137-S8]
MDDAPSPQNSTPTRVESFYFDDDPMAMFLVEDKLFKVHRHYFIQGSEIFRDMFSQTKTPEEAEGMSDDKPIILPNVTVKEFKTLLRYFYAMTLPMPNGKVLADILVFEQDEKLALISIAHQFCFDKIYEYILGEIEPGMFPLVDRVRLGDQYGLKNWLSSAYKTILERTPDQKLSLEEADALGLKRTVNILEAKNSILHEVHDLKNVQSTVVLITLACSCCTQQMNDISVGEMENAVARAVENLLS